jgi:predicted phage terminase large subunit-like protein
MHPILAELGATPEQILCLPISEQEEILKLVEVYDHQIEIEKCRTSFYAFMRKMWHVVEGNPYIEGRHHKVIADTLDKAAEGKLKRIIFAMPPRHSKSLMVSKLFPAYFIGRNASRKIIQACNVKGLADQFGAAVRSVLMSPEYQEIFPETKLDVSSTAKGDWATTKSGKYFAVGVGGTMTGQGGDCLAGDTLIETPQGKMRLDDFVEMENKPLVLSFDHTTGKRVWSKVVASRVLHSAETYSVRTEMGREFVGTPDHRVFVVGKGYTPISALCVGDELVTAEPVLGKKENLPPQERRDRVAVVTRVHRSDNRVYDIQVEGTCNFFAEEVLVHNCIILDDLHDEREAVIGLVRPEIYDSTYSWYKSGPRQRLQPQGCLIVVMTRWSKRDLTGQVLAEDKDNEWTVIEFPAILPSGKPLWPEFWSLEELNKVKDNIGAMRWNAQYMQQPTSVELSMIKPTDWRPWSEPGERKDPPRCTFTVQSWDTAHSAKKHANPSACTTWGITEIEKRPALVLLHAWQDRVEFPELKVKAREMYKEWRPDYVIVESQASGRPLMAELRVSGIPVVEFKAQSGVDKITRVNAVTDLFKAGFIYYMPSMDTNMVVEQFQEFPAGAADDLVDSSTAALDLLKRQINEFRHREATEDDEEDDDSHLVRSRMRRKFY